MNRFLLVRHGKTLNNEAGRLSGWIDTPLVVDGLVPTDRVIEKLRATTIDEIYSSDLGRAFITAYYIARALGFNGEIYRSPGLREVNYGIASNMLSAEAYAKYPQLDRDTQFVPEGGESLAQMQTRVLSEVTAIDERYTNKTVLLVAHSGVMAALDASHRGIDFGGHNISEAYEHDFVADFTVSDGVITTFSELR